ncbi:methylaspartate mutase accessory protein GlmL [Fusobacterium gastrosuis]|uniref:methylaspartate mutase accessory protein GlmL n=1 Tax=Fusobacterium gastrosuis TaxID=1755100 RepID=UPI0029745CDE|nr:methylaspartate mutase accessory protein GlmL [Fusobacteriaceae bacterium]MDY5305465.1 methylaspartate mutase accessory protein GlmL [Fusobacterium gastrosuis]MDY5712790.1 methylaspartate mutase accessory protein GlmL [Fusobacterium gastrosuis]
MIEVYLAIDFGSTYTKLTAINLNDREIIASTKALTTVEIDVMQGFDKAYGELLDILDNKFGKNYIIKYRNACSSAAGGLKIVAVGLVPDLTTEATKIAALSAGARVIKTYAFALSDSDIEEIENLDYDILVLSGGTNGGNREYILKNARKIVESKIIKTVIVAGNEYVQDEIKEIFKNSKFEFFMSENVMPVVNKINAENLREIIREVFMKNIVKAKGMENVQKIVENIIMPTPAAVMKAAEILSDGTENIDGIGNVLVVDIGGATTDVHSIGKGLPKTNNIQLKGLEEPYSKRTVEGDLGMSYSSMALYEATTLNKIRAYLGRKESKISIKDSFKYREQNPNFIAEQEEDLLFNEMMAMICTEIATNRHAGVLECIYSPMGTIFSQSGKDLTDIKYIVGTGGIIANSRNPQKILELALYKEEDTLSLKPKYAKFLVDKEYILSAMGLLSKDFPDIALEIMKKNMIEV